MFFIYLQHQSEKDGLLARLLSTEDSLNLRNSKLQEVTMQLSRSKEGARYFEDQVRMGFMLTKAFSQSKMFILYKVSNLYIISSTESNCLAYVERCLKRRPPFTLKFMFNLRKVYFTSRAFW